MKFADGPTTSVSLDIKAPAAAIWQLCSQPDFPVESSEELDAAAWDPEGPGPGVGARILGSNSRQNPSTGKESAWSTVSTIVEWEPDKRLSYCVGDVEHAVSQWWFEIEPQGDGVQRLTQRLRLGPGESGLTRIIARKPDAEEKIVALRLAMFEESMRRNLELIKATVE